MKSSKKRDPLEIEGVKKLKKFYKTYEDLASVSITWMGSAQLIVEFILDNYKDPSILPQRAAYGMGLYLYHYRVLSMILREQITPEEFSMEYLPISDTAWEDAKELDERLVLVVKQLYKMLQEDGKIE